MLVMDAPVTVKLPILADATDAPVTCRLPALAEATDAPVAVSVVTVAVVSSATPAFMDAMEALVDVRLVTVPVVITAVPALAEVMEAVVAARAATPVMVPLSSTITTLFWISLPVVRSNRAMALSVAEAGPTTSPDPPPPAVAHDKVPEPLVDSTCPLEPSAEGSV